MATGDGQAGTKEGVLFLWDISPEQIYTFRGRSLGQETKQGLAPSFGVWVAPDACRDEQDPGSAS